MAIARDVHGLTSTPGTGETSNTLALNIGASTTLLLAFLTLRSGGDTATGVTWNGVAMTLANKFLANNVNNAFIYCYYTLNPTTGSHNMVASFPARSDNTYLVGVSYTGTETASFPDNFTTAGPTAGTSLSTTLTPVASGAWGIQMAYSNSGVSTVNFTLLETYAGAVQDTNGTISGSTTMTFTSPIDVLGAMMYSIAPPTASVTTSPTHSLSLLGVGQ